MPSREEERNANKKSDMRYCTEHESYYYTEFGCQQCAFDGFKPKIKAEESTELKKCLKCKRPSLFWNTQNEIYECLNKKCKRQFTKNQVIEAEVKGETAIKDNEPHKKKGKSLKKKK
ncbi:hypothetical protein ACFLVR_02785 [Chloroflexota bacterium]